MTDLAVPRPPEMRTPPMSLFTLASNKAVLMLSWPTTMDKGRPSCSERAVISFEAPSWASIAAILSSGVIVAVCGRMPRAAGALGASHAEAQPATASRRAARAILRRAIFLNLYGRDEQAGRCSASRAQRYRCVSYQATALLHCARTDAVAEQQTRCVANGLRHRDGDAIGSMMLKRKCEM